jgi:acetolactate synthase-1/3 small subunit
MAECQYTLSVLTESETSALLRLTACLGRQRVRIQSLTCTNGDAEVYRHTVVVRAEPDRIRRAMKQIGATVGVLEASYHADGDTLDREIALFKLSVEAKRTDPALERLIRAGRARILVVAEDYIVVEKTGVEGEIEEFLDRLRPFGVIEFVRSGRVIVTKPVHRAAPDIE